jgi:transcriptional regulator with XRE-family HTH domain
VIKDRKLPIEKYIKIAERLKLLRETHHFTQAQVAEKIGVTVKTYREWEVGKYAKNNYSERYYPVIDPQNLILLSELYGVSIDYLLCQSEFTSPENNFIGNYTGLTDDSINALHLIKTGADNKLWHNTELETLNFILENIRRIQQLNNGIGFTDSILNYIGLYLHNGTIHKEPATHVHYKHDNTKWDFLKNGDTVNGNEVQAVEILADNTNTNINNPDKIPVYDSANDNHYTLDFNKLLESHALNKVTEKLIELKNRYENEE